MKQVVMPKIGLNMQEGTIVEWVKKEGDPIKCGDILFVVETDKVTVDSESQQDGVLAKILVAEGQRVPVKTPVAILVDASETYEEGSQPGIDNERADISPYLSPINTVPFQTEGDSAFVDGKTLASPKARNYARENGIDLAKVREGVYGVIKYQQVVEYSQSAKNSDSSVVMATPIARRIAREHGIDLMSLGNTSASGKITRKDVESVLSSPNPERHTALHPKTIPLEGVRAVTAERMQQSFHATAPVTLHTEVDATQLVEFRQSRKRGGQKEVPSYNAILMSITAEALQENPMINSTLDQGIIHLNDQINIGLAVDQTDGLRVMVVRDVDKKTVEQIQVDLNDLIARVQRKRSLPEDLSGGTFTITNLGGYGVDHFTPIINPPEAGILGVGRILEKLVIKDGKIAQRHMLTLSLTFDHRVVDGAPAARFLQKIAQLIEGYGS
ncbi:MAG: 2-oxo acid dehydrogenase subunit E2 [Anaerolineales bacterium]|nr:2-oxo acid dehydrogenase subunit E2 [Anaerolineales bacterium]